MKMQVTDEKEQELKINLTMTFKTELGEKYEEKTTHFQTEGNQDFDFGREKGGEISHFQEVAKFTNQLTQ